MFRKFLMIAAIAFFNVSLMAEEKALPAPDMSAGLPVMETFAARRSVRNYAAKELAEQDLSNLLWCAMGKNRPDGKLTAPSCRNFQEIRLFVFDKDGVGEYLPASHSIRSVATGDYRNLIAAGQDFVNDAPVSLVMIADMTKFPDRDEKALMMASVDAGIVSENISVGCAGLGLVTVPRATMKVDEILALLGLSADYIPIMNNPVGYISE